ncbi:MAG: hypothetical protein CMM91_00505 [Rickettsiales bacterium]|nr:hypothetical protein [Rickettsiales bacterium]OUV54887.1 MAG: hypothetical protein CBC87_00010 [Rickettsiales bacterium TMED127]|tara:strand:- start:3407 stop:4801 length:1395 start_codon:yes stop_codon:yes gene_type:complete
MIFFAVPSVGQLKPDTLFGNDDHYGFLQTLVGKKYDRNIVSNLCKEYYGKINDRYWDQIITISNFLAFKKLNEKENFVNIPFLDFVSEQFDLDQKIISRFLFEYYLLMWQFPHPINSTQKIKFSGLLDISSFRLRKFEVNKPYISILKILFNLEQIEKGQGFLKDDEFYFLGVEFYRTEGKILFLDQVTEISEKIYKLRKNGGWTPFDEIKKKKLPHLSYPKGFLRNSFFLNVEKDIKLNNFAVKNEKNIENLLEGFSNLKFNFSSTINPRDLKLYNNFSNYLYDDNKFKVFEDLISFVQKDFKFSNPLVDFAAQNFNEEISKKYRIEKILSKIGNLDRKVIKRQRAEQHYLRQYIIDGETCECAICQKSFPSNLITTAHIKKRLKCNDDEKRDTNVIMPLCDMGCDRLFELKFLVVNSGFVKKGKNKKITDDLDKYMKPLIGKKCKYYNNKTKKYFEFHENES